MRAGHKVITVVLHVLARVEPACGKPTGIAPD